MIRNCVHIFRNYWIPIILMTPLKTNLLDDPIWSLEVDSCLKRLNAGKATGMDGIAPGVLKLDLLTQLSNSDFFSTMKVHVFPIYKKGAKNYPENYRGIDISSVITKLYDMVLSQRFALWYTPRGRGVRSKSSLYVSSLILSDTRRKLSSSTIHRPESAYIDPTIDSVNTCGPDDWLGNLHILLLMVFASSCKTPVHKLDLLKRAADKIGMNRAQISNQVKTHMNNRQKHIIQFYSFVAKTMTVRMC